MAAHDYATAKTMSGRSLQFTPNGPDRRPLTATGLHGLTGPWQVFLIELLLEAGVAHIIYW